MKFLAQEIPGVMDHQFTPEILKTEAAQAWKLYQDGIIREMYFRADRHEAILLLECASLEEAQVTLASLPLVQKGLIAFDIAPLIPYDGFARLFHNDT